MSTCWSDQGSLEVIINEIFFALKGMPIFILSFNGDFIACSILAHFRAWINPILGAQVS